MQQTPVAVTVVGMLMLAFLGLMFIAGIVGAIMFFAAPPGTGVRRVGRSLAIVCPSVLGILLIIVFMVSAGLYFVRDQSRQAATIHTPQAVAPLSPPVSAEPLVTPTLPSPNPPPESTNTGQNPVPGLANTTQPADAAAAVALTGHDDRTTTVALPDWIKKPETKTGDVRQLVISSQQYATIAEARSEITKQARRILADDFETIFHTRSNDLNNLSNEQLQQISVKQEFVETVERDFGNFYAPMHRLWWKLELSPVVRSEIYPRWKAMVQEIRVLIVGGSLIGLTILFGVFSLFRSRGNPLPISPTGE